MYIVNIIKYLALTILVFIGFVGCGNNSRNTNPDCEISGKVILPKNPNLKIKDIDVSIGLLDTASIDDKGMFCISKQVLSRNDREKGANIFAMIQTADSKGWAIIASAKIFPDEHHIELSSLSTATYIVHSLFLRRSSKGNKESYNSIYSLNETEEFARYLEAKLSSDLYFLIPNQLIKNKEYGAYINKVARAFSK